MKEELQHFEEAVLGCLGVAREEADSISSMMERWGEPRSKLQRTLNRLIKYKLVLRRWDGNARFGRYLYWAKD